MTSLHVEGRVIPHNYLLIMQEKHVEAAPFEAVTSVIFAELNLCVKTIPRIHGLATQMAECGEFYSPGDEVLVW